MNKPLILDLNGMSLSGKKINKRALELSNAAVMHHSTSSKEANSGQGYVGCLFNPLSEV